MRVERTMKRALAPVTGPASRRRLIGARDRAVSTVAGVRGRTGPERLDPGFLVIGAQKAGTTFLYQELVRHPAVRPALTKELHYFDDRYERGSAWYRGHFPSARSGVVTGEASPGYLFHPHAPSRVAADLPDAKAIAVLRDPVERAYSQWRHECRLGYEPIDDFAEAVAAEEERTAGEIERVERDPSYVSFAFRHYTYKARGRYLGQVDRWIGALGADRVLTLAAEDLYGDPIRTLHRVHDFLGLDRWTPEDVGRNDMSSTSSPLDRSTGAALARYFEPEYGHLQEELGVGGSWGGAW